MIIKFFKLNDMNNIQKKVYDNYNMNGYTYFNLISHHLFITPYINDNPVFNNLNIKYIESMINVIEKNNDGFYNLVEYTKRKVLLLDIPGYILANNICNALNSKKSINLNFAQTIVGMHHKLSTDCMYYRHTIGTTKDEFRREVAITRLDITIQQLKNVNRELATLK
jgi:hypothetical protein